MTDLRWHIPLAEIMAEVATLPPTDRAAFAIRHGTMRAGIYAPTDSDNQTPHDQDELYIVISGSAVLVKSGIRVAVRPQDLLFVEAGAKHCFESLSTDFAAWVVFWGPKGGERR